MSAEFNEEQKKAITHKDGPAMVLAGPGSGKTHHHPIGRQPERQQHPDGVQLISCFLCGPGAMEYS